MLLTGIIGIVLLALSTVADDDWHLRSAPEKNINLADNATYMLIDVAHASECKSKNEYVFPCMCFRILICTICV